MLTTTLLAGVPPPFFLMYTSIACPLTCAYQCHGRQPSAITVVDCSAFVEQVCITGDGTTMQLCACVRARQCGGGDEGVELHTYTARLQFWMCLSLFHACHIYCVEVLQVPEHRDGQLPEPGLDRDLHQLPRLHQALHCHHCGPPRLCLRVSRPQGETTTSPTTPLPSLPGAARLSEWRHEDREDTPCQQQMIKERSL